MSNKEERKAPVLRFKGFTDDWEQRKFTELGKLYYGKSAPKWSVVEKGGTPCIRYGELYTKYSSKIDNVYSHTSIDKSKLKFSTGNELLIPRVGEEPLDFAKHTSWLSIPNVAIGEMITVLKTKENPLFLANYLRAKYVFKFARLVEGGNVSNLYFERYEDTNILIPSKNEQQNISKLILKIDKLIALQQRKLDQLKQLKKAYLSDLFSIKNKPQIRFKGFKGKWKKSKLLDNVSNIIDFRGKTPKKLGMDWSDQGILALSALNVKDGFIDKSIHAHYGDIKLYNKWMAGNKLHKGQVLFTTEAPMGNVAQVPDNDKYILSQRTIAFNVNKDKISDSFLAMLLQTTTVHNQLLSLSSGGTAKGVSQKSLSGLSVAIPLSLEEQRKMEMTFKYINHLIHFQQDKIRYLEENKQFLLQNMFI